eukprot:917984-Prymnesium_polylepis.1
MGACEGCVRIDKLAQRGECAACKKTMRRMCDACAEGLTRMCQGCREEACRGGAPRARLPQREDVT